MIILVICNDWVRVECIDFEFPATHTYGVRYMECQMIECNIFHSFDFSQLIAEQKHRKMRTE